MTPLLRPHQDGVSDIPHVLLEVVETYLQRTGISGKPGHRVDNFAMGISLVALTRGVALLPAYGDAKSGGYLADLT